MSGIKMPHAPSLTEWLEIATAELTPPAKKRIRLEIEEHFAAAVESHTANGCSETDAQSTALAELGDPTVAAKHFRSRHLTEKEAQYIERTLKSYSRGWILFLPLFVVSALLWLPYFHFLKRHDAPAVLLAAAAAIIVYVIPMISFFVARRSNARPDIRLLLLLQLLNQGGFTVYGIWWTVRIDWGMLGMLVVFFWRFFRDLRFWYKLGKIGGVWQDMPPNKTAAS
jgi:uncharacterized membrane protein